MQCNIDYMFREQFTYYNNAEIDRQKWDNTVLVSENGNIYALSTYLDIVNPGWCAFIEGDYESVFPVPVKKKAGISYVMQPIFSQQLGLYCIEKLSERQWKTLLNALRKKYPFILINIPAIEQQILKTAGYRYHAHNNYLLDISKDYLKIRSGYSNNLKRNLLKSEEFNLEIRKSCEYAKLIQMFRENKGKEIPFLTEERYGILYELIKNLSESGMGTIEFVFHNNEAIAGVFWAEWNEKSIFLFSALTQQGRQCHAMPFLIDSYIKNKASIIKTLDFEGSDDESLARFYRGFGAVLSSYITIETTMMSFLQKIRNFILRGH